MLQYVHACSHAICIQTETRTYGQTHHYIDIYINISVKIGMQMYNQGIIDFTGEETFAKEPKLVKLFRELLLTPVRHHTESSLVLLVCWQR